MEKTIFLPETIIDAHCHGRDMEESYKTTVEQTLREAKSGNIGITVFLCRIPNHRSLIKMRCHIRRVNMGVSQIH